MQESWGAEFTASLYGIIQDDASATGGFDSLGGSFGYLSEHSYLVFNAPGVSLTVTHTTIEQISPDELFSDMPKWVMNAYKNQYGIDYKSLLK